jgi:virginiamycin B lyase
MQGVSHLRLANAATMLLAAFWGVPGDAHASGDGAALIQGVCTGCHQLNQIENSAGYTADGWRELIGTMIDLEGTAVLDRITAYMAEHHPPNDRRAPVVVEGPVSLTFTEWVAPTLGERSRDPIEAPDGAIWWAGMWADKANRVDPATGEITVYDLPPGTRPHTVTADADGRIWFTGNGNGTMGRLDPQTGDITVWEMPDADALDPHSAIVDEAGIVWFTLQRSNMVGRLDPVTGAIILMTMPTADSRPYGIKLAADGTPWVTSNGSNRLYRIDSYSMEITEFPVSDEGTTIRRLAFASDGGIWYVNSGLGRLGRLDPETGDFKEWDSPSGPASHPYAIAVIDDIVWYNESRQRPDMLVRFDPRTETFQSWAIPSGNIHAGIVRHMRPTRSGDLLIHQSSTNRVILVQASDPPVTD